MIQCLAVLFTEQDYDDPEVENIDLEAQPIPMDSNIELAREKNGVLLRSNEETIMFVPGEGNIGFQRHTGNWFEETVIFESFQSECHTQWFGFTCTKFFVLMVHTKVPIKSTSVLCCC